MKICFFPLKPSENSKFSDNFKGNKLINSLKFVKPLKWNLETVPKCLPTRSVNPFRSDFPIYFNIFHLFIEHLQTIASIFLAVEYSLHKKWSFPLTISSVNGKLHFLCRILDSIQINGNIDTKWVTVILR